MRLGLSATFFSFLAKSLLFEFICIWFSPTAATQAPWRDTNAGPSFNLNQYALSVRQVLPHLDNIIWAQYKINSNLSQGYRCSNRWGYTLLQLSHLGATISDLQATETAEEAVKYSGQLILATSSKLYLPADCKTWITCRAGYPKGCIAVKMITKLTISFPPSVFNPPNCSDRISQGGNSAVGLIGEHRHGPNSESSQIAKNVKWLADWRQSSLQTNFRTCSIHRYHHPFPTFEGTNLLLCENKMTQKALVGGVRGSQR